MTAHRPPVAPVVPAVLTAPAVQTSRVARTARRHGGRGWRVLGTASLAAAVAAVVTGLAYGALVKTGAGTGKIAVGSVTLAAGSAAAHACSFSEIEPGDLPDTSGTPCNFPVAYTGSAPAYLSLSVLVEATAGSAPGAAPLYDGGSAGLTLTITDNQSTPVTYASPAAATACPSGTAGGTTCYALTDELVSTSPVTSGASFVFTVTPSFATSAGNPFQGGAATVLLTARAVQAAGNSLACATGRSPAVAGEPCTGSSTSTFQWS